MNQKGILLASETLKIVIAVISITFLVYFLTSLYFTGITKEKMREAEAILKTSGESLGNVINLLGEGEEKQFQFPNPSNWYLFSFVEDKPNSCAGKNCLCICGNALVKFFNGQIKKCDKEGSCLILDNLKEFEQIKIQSPQKSLTKISVKKINNEVQISEIK